MEQDNNLPEEIIIPQVIKDDSAELNVRRGRPTVEESEETKNRYLRIHQLKVNNDAMTLDKIAYACDCSIGTVKNALRYVRKNYPLLSSRENLVDQLVVVNTRLGEVNKLLAVLEAGTPILMPDGTPLLMLNSDGSIKKDEKGNPKPHMKFQHDLILRYRRDRRDDEMRKVELLGLLKKNDIDIINANIYSTINITQNQDVALINSMSPEDKQKFLEIAERYVGRTES